MSPDEMRAILQNITGSSDVDLTADNEKAMAVILQYVLDVSVRNFQLIKIINQQTKILAEKIGSQLPPLE
jgi:hypothetical protein